MPTETINQQPATSATQQTQTQQQTQTPQPQPAAAPAKKTKLIDKSLVVATINKLPPMLAPIAGCFNDAWDSFAKAYGHNAGKVMACEIDYATQALVSKPYLLKVATANPFSLVSAMKNLALAGYTLNPIRKQCYLVPMKDEVVFMPSYMGLVDELSASGLVKKIEAHPVFEGEKFEIKHGSQEGLWHSPNPWVKRDKENLLGCYWYAVLVDDTVMFDTIGKDDIERIRMRAPSSSAKSSPWDTDYIEMARKTAIRNGFKKIPKKNISEEKLKVLGMLFDYEEKAHQSWLSEQNDTTSKKDPFDEEVEFEEVI